MADLFFDDNLIWHQWPVKSVGRGSRRQIFTKNFCRILWLKILIVARFGVSNFGTTKFLTTFLAPILGFLHAVGGTEANLRWR